MSAEATLSEINKDADKMRRNLMREISEFEAKYHGSTIIIETVTNVSQSGYGQMIRLSTYVKTEIE